MCLIIFVVCVLNEKECCYWKEGERETDTVPDLQRKAVGYMRDKLYYI